MELLILIACVPAALAIYFVIVKPIFIPLTSRIPTGKEYQPTFGAR